MFKDVELDKLMKLCHSMHINDDTIAKTIDLFPYNLSDKFLSFFENNYLKIYNLLILKIYTGDKSLLAEKTVKITLNLWNEKK